MKKNLIAIVTGASRGIGQALAMQLAEKGARLVLAARDAPRLAAVAESCRKLGAEAIYQVTDVTDEAQCRTLVDAAVERFDGIDLLIANAGGSLRGFFQDFESLEPLRRVMTVNYFGSIYCTRWALPHLVRSKGRIVVVSSLAGKLGMPGRAGYSASKHAVHGFFDSLRMELAGTGVSITLSCPGYVATDLRSRALGVDGREIGSSDAKVEATALSADACAAQILRATRRRQREVLHEASGRLALALKYIWPGLLDRAMRRKMES